MFSLPPGGPVLHLLFRRSPEVLTAPAGIVIQRPGQGLTRGSPTVSSWWRPRFVSRRRAHSGDEKTCPKSCLSLRLGNDRLRAPWDTPPAPRLPVLLRLFQRSLFFSFRVRF